MPHPNNGVGAIASGRAACRKKSEELRQNALAAAIDTVKELEFKLAEFAKTHKHAIQRDPEFRAKFLEMCKPLGVDPLSAENGFWGSKLGIGEFCYSMLGIGEFYYELSVKVAEICLASRSRNGGIMRVSEVMDILAHRGTKFQFNDSKNKTTYTEKDIITSVKKLSKLGSGFSTIKVGRVVLIVSIPEELDKDHMEVLKLAEKEPDGMVRTEVVSKELEWDIERSNRALELLLSKGMVWLDVHCGGNKYWFPR